MKYYLVAGERSGDLHASNLIKAIRQQDAHAVFKGLGGHYMRSAGTELFLDYRDIAVMGFVEVIKNVFRFRKILHDCRDDIRHFKPDAVILVDFAGFNLRLAKMVKKAGIRVFYYISPKIWAWNAKRGHKVKKYVDELFVILPFETDFYQEFDVIAHYVGNPVVDAVQDFSPPSSDAKGQERKLVALLPGSRRHEIEMILPIMLQLAELYPQVRFGVSAVRNIPAKMYAEAEKLGNVQVLYEDNYNLLYRAECAIVASGTATLETALFGVPQIVVYKLNPINWIIGRIFVKLPYISLVNLIAGRAVVKELLQREFSLENLRGEFHAVLYDRSTRNCITAGYAEIREILGNERASDKAAGIMIRLLQHTDL